jgi:hypothetical protein
VRRRRRLRSAGVEEVGESSEQCGRVGREAVWKRRTRHQCGRDLDRVIRMAWVVERERVVRTRAREVELARAARESERPSRAGVDVPTLVFPNKNWNILQRTLHKG